MDPQIFPQVDKNSHSREQNMVLLSGKRMIGFQKKQKILILKSWDGKDHGSREKDMEGL